MKFALDIAKGMEYLHSLEQLIPRLYLKSTHVMVGSNPVLFDENLTLQTLICSRCVVPENIFSLHFVTPHPSHLPPGLSVNPLWGR